MNPMQFWIQLAEQWQKAWADTMAFWAKAGRSLDGLGQGRPDLESRGSDNASPQAIAWALERRRRAARRGIAKASSMLGSLLAFTTTTRTPVMGVGGARR
jgi:hypothetical protein